MDPTNRLAGSPKTRAEESYWEAHQYLRFLRLESGGLPGLVGRHACAVQLVHGVARQRGVPGCIGLCRRRLRPLVRQCRLRPPRHRLVVLGVGLLMGGNRMIIIRFTTVAQCA